MKQSDEPAGSPQRALSPRRRLPHSAGVTLREVFRITVFVPPDAVETVLAGVERAVPLRFGDYDGSAWWSAVGVEQFRPLPGAKPTVGTPGKTERVPTVRLEFAIPRDRRLLDRVLAKGVKAHHPWQEPAVFVDETFATATRLVEPDELPDR